MDPSIPVSITLYLTLKEEAEKGGWAFVPDIYVVYITEEESEWWDKEKILEDYPEIRFEQTTSEFDITDSF